MEEYDIDRGRTRIDYSAHALIKSTTRKMTADGEVRDISMNSAYLFMDSVFDINEQVDLRIILFGQDSRLTVELSATVARIDDDGIALTFLSPLEWWPIFTLFPFHKLDRDNSLSFVRSDNSDKG